VGKFHKALRANVVYRAVHLATEAALLHAAVRKADQAEEKAAPVLTAAEKVPDNTGIY
jgi:hypothetical protein